MTVRRALDVAALRREQLRILDLFDELCGAHSLTYYLWGGSLLGAIKFRGYIPWDDDIDVAMPREDYQRLQALPSEELPAGLRLMSPHATPGHVLPYLKLGSVDTLLVDHSAWGLETLVNIDVFPLDRVPPGLVGRWRRWLTFVLVRLLRTSMYPLGTGWRRQVRLLARLVMTGTRTRQRLGVLIDRLAHYRGPDRGSWRMAVWARGTPIPCATIAPPQLRPFEGRDRPTPADPTPILKLVYGDDWREGLPRHQRTTEHRFEAFRLEPDDPAGQGPAGSGSTGSGLAGDLLDGHGEG